MYTYYFCAAMRWPFPRAIKRNLTTLQIAQIASGTLLTNLYLLIKLDPSRVIDGFKANQVSSWYQPIPTRDESLFIYATTRAASSDPGTCLQSTGAEIALHVNTMYMFVSIAFLLNHASVDMFTNQVSLPSLVPAPQQPLLALFFNFFMRSYLHKKLSAQNGLAERCTAAQKK